MQIRLRRNLRPFCVLFFPCTGSALSECFMTDVCVTCSWDPPMLDIDCSFLTQSLCLVVSAVRRLFLTSNLNLSYWILSPSLFLGHEKQIIFVLAAAAFFLLLWPHHPFPTSSSVLWTKCPRTCGFSCRDLESIIRSLLLIYCGFSPYLLFNSVPQSSLLQLTLYLFCTEQRDYITR